MISKLLRIFLLHISYFLFNYAILLVSMFCCTPSICYIFQFSCTAFILDRKKITSKYLIAKFTFQFLMDSFQNGCTYSQLKNLNKNWSLPALSLLILKFTEYWKSMTNYWSESKQFCKHSYKLFIDMLTSKLKSTTIASHSVH